MTTFGTVLTALNQMTTQMAADINMLAIENIRLIEENEQLKRTNRSLTETAHGLGKCAKAAVTEIKKLRAMLRRLEWAGEHTYWQHCPICKQNRRHAPDCELSALLEDK